MELRRRGAEVVLVPSAFMVPTGRAHWHVLLRSESFCIVVAVAVVDDHHVVCVPICWCSSACLSLFGGCVGISHSVGIGIHRLGHRDSVLCVGSGAIWPA